MNKCGPLYTQSMTAELSIDSARNANSVPSKLVKPISSLVPLQAVCAQAENRMIAIKEISGSDL